MTPWAALLVLLAPAAVLALPAAPPAVVPGTMPGVERPDRARINYILKCQGCHGPRAEGNRTTTPAMAGSVARFLGVPGGRAFLARVPGVATAAVSDAELAELLNWTVQHFDRDHMPQGFAPYTAAEVGGLRHNPLRTDTSVVRQSLIAALESQGATGHH